MTLQERIGLIDAAIALNKPDQDEHTMITNLTLLSDNIDDFPPSLLISCTEHLMKFRMVRVLGIPDRQERQAAIGSLVTSLEFWTIGDISDIALLDYKNASLVPLFKKLEHLMKTSVTEGRKTTVSDPHELYRYRRYVFVNYFL